MKTIRKSSKHDWSRLDAMTAEERTRAAKSDPDAQPLTAEDFARMKPTPRVKLIRRALHLSAEEFSERYAIPVATIRDWEAGRSEPDQSMRAYLKVIANDPDGIRRVLVGADPAVA